MCMYVYVCVCMCMYVYVCVCMYVRTYVCMYVYVCVLEYTFPPTWALAQGSRLKDKRLCQDEKSLSHFVICDFERSGRLERIATLG